MFAIAIGFWVKLKGGFNNLSETFALPFIFGELYMIIILLTLSLADFCFLENNLKLESNFDKHAKKYIS